MIHATFPAAVLTAGEASGTSRTVAGVAVPWDVEGQVSDGRVIRFARGSLDAGARPLLLRDHDRTRPLGRVTDATEADSGMLVQASISRTRDGDEALVLAADGVLGAFSVGVNPTAHHYDDDVLVVDAGEWQELSLLTFGAFPGAQVATVAATAGPDIDVPIDDPEEEEEPEEEEPEDPTEDPEEEPDVSTITDPVPAVAAGAPAVVPLTTNAPPPGGPESLTMTRLSRMVAAGAPAADIMAALADVTTTTVAGVVVPAALTEIRGLIEYGRPVISSVNRAALPPSGMNIEYPKWGVLPDIATQAAQKTEIASAAATITTESVPVLTFAGGNDISLAAVQRSNPSFVEAYLRAAAEVFARKTEGHAVSALLTAATAVTPAATFLDSVEAMVAAFNPLTVPSGNLFLAMSWDVGASMIGVTTANGPAFWDGTVSLNALPEQASGAGMNLFVSRQLPAKTMLMGVSNGATWYEDPANPQEIRVVDVSLLGLNIAVYGFACLAVEEAAAFKKMTFTTLPTSLSAAPSKK